MSDMTPEQINAALQAGIITETQARTMRAKAGKSSTSKSTADSNQAVIGNEDDMRFLRSFSDVFISIGLGLLVLGISALAMLMGGGQVFLAAAALVYVMAEYFGRRKRQHLPTLVMALAFLWFIQLGLTGLVFKQGLGGDLTVAFVTCLAMLAFYIRIRLPFCVALIGISLLYLFYAILARIAPDVMASNIGWLLFFGGAVTLSVAMLYDMNDQHRTTRFADNAFWLHLLAAPLIIHGLAVEFVSAKTERIMDMVSVPTLDKGDATIVMIMVIVLAIFGLAINRRALLVSSLGYAGIAIGFLMKDSGMSMTYVVTLTLIILGATVTFLGVGWHQGRDLLLRILPNWKIFPPAFDPDFGKG